MATDLTDLMNDLGFALAALDELMSSQLFTGRWLENDIEEARDILLRLDNQVEEASNQGTKIDASIRDELDVILDDLYEALAMLMTFQKALKILHDDIGDIGT